MCDVFYILSTPEIFYYHAIIVKASLVTLVTCAYAVGFGVDSCGGAGDLSLLPYTFATMESAPLICLMCAIQ